MAIDRFEGKYFFLSNFYVLRNPITDGNGISYPTTEHYFQAMKDIRLDIRKRVAAEPNPGAAKRAGSKKGYVVLRDNWENVKIDIMYEALQKKFEDPILRQLLSSTGDEELIEGNNWFDRYWGVCDGVGRNELGKLLMKLREEVR